MFSTGLRLFSSHERIAKKVTSLNPFNALHFLALEKIFFAPADSSAIATQGVAM